jgi:hypothetical protein
MTKWRLVLALAPVIGAAIGPSTASADRVRHMNYALQQR